MDPISCAMSVASAVGTCYKIIQFINKTKRGHKEREKLQTEVDSTYRLLLSIQDQLNQKPSDNAASWFRCIEPLFKDGGDIAALKQALEDIVARLNLDSKSRWSEMVKTLKWPLESAEVVGMTVRVERVKTNISIALNRANLELSKDTNANVKQVQSAVAKAHLQQVINWLSPLDFRTMQQSPQKRALEKTGEWLFNRVEFLGWADRRAPSIWCHGIPGAGKTFLASAAFDRLQHRCKDDNSLVIIVFFDFNDKSTHSVDAIISCILRQAVETRSDMTDKVKALFDGSGSDGKAARPTVEGLQSAIKEEFKHFDHIYAILDGLDEIPSEKTRSDVLDTVEALDPRLQLMVSSRPLMDIKAWFCEQAKDHRCAIPQSLDASSDTDSDASGDDWTDIASKNEPLYGCEICQFADLDGLVAYQPACYTCQDCQHLICGDCYDQYDVCVSCNCEKSRISYLWPREIEIAAQPQDLELYVRWRIAQSPTHDRHFERAAKSGHDLKADIIESVVESSGQMFLLATFHVDKLLNLATPREMLKAAKSLHDDIHLIYKDVFERIATFSGAAHIERLIQIVAFARKPLDTVSLEHAIAFALGCEEVDSLDLPDAIDLVNKCLGLVMVDSSGIVRLSHETVGDYIRQQKSMKAADGDTVMAKICLSYLGQSPIRDALRGPSRLQQLEALAHRLPLLPYAAIYWGVHARGAGTGEIIAQTQAFLGNETLIVVATQMMWYDNLERGTGWDADDAVTGLHLAAHFGLIDAISFLLAKGESVNAVDCMGSTPLMYAVDSGHGEAVSILLHANADASVSCKRGRTALHRACYNLDIFVVRQLIELQGDIAVNALDTSLYNESALQYVAQTEEADILKLLLTRSDIDVNMYSGTKFKSTALHFAVSDWGIGNLKVLLEDDRIEIDNTDSFLTTALSMACSEDNYDAVALLLDHGADPSIPDTNGGPALLRAIDGNCFNSVRLLVERGVDYHFVDLFRRGVLHGCAVNNRPQILRYLLQTKSDLDPNSQGDRGETPMHDAVVQGYGRVVTTLLDFGARTDIRDNVGRTPLRAAREANRPDILRLLMEARKKEQAADVPPRITAMDKMAHADTMNFDEPLPIHAAVRCYDAAEFEAYLNAQGENVSKIIDQLDNDGKNTAIQIAVIESRNETMRLLIKHGADLDIQDIWGWTALHLAASWRNLEAAQELVKCNASLNLKDKQNRTPLDLAMGTGQDSIETEIVMLFVKHGGLATKNNTRLLWALRAAVECNEFDVVKLLCAQGAPCNAHIGGRSTPYQLAKKKGLNEIADFLLEEMKRRQSALLDSAATPKIANLTALDSTARPSSDEKQEVDILAEEESGGKPVSAVAMVTPERTGLISSLTKRECCLMAIICMLFVLILLR